MTQLPLYNVEENNVGKISAKEEIFGSKPNEQAVYSALCWFQASQRRGTHSTKTRAEVRGGGKKPWRQKGTGRARAGSIRSPLWRKGGVVFGPKPRNYGYALPKKVRKLALRVALSDKAREGKLKVVEKFSISAPKTKLALKFLKGLDLSGKVLLVLGEENEIFSKAARNITGIKLMAVNELNIFDLMNSDWVVPEKSAVLKMEEVLARAS